MSYPLWGLLQEETKTLDTSNPDVVYLRLQYNGMTWSMSREKLLKYFPDSLIGQSIKTDPTTQIIELTQPIITPEVMSFLWFMVEYEMVPAAPWNESKSTPDQSPLFLSGAYLNIPIMMLASRPYFPELLGNHQMNYLNPDDYGVTNLLDLGYRHSDWWLLRYISNRLHDVKDYEQHIIDQFLSRSIIDNRLDVFIYLLQHGVKIATARFNPPMYTFDNRPNHINADVLRKAIDVLNYQSAILAVWYNRVTFVQYLLDHKLLPDDIIASLLVEAVKAQNPDLVTILAHDDRIPHWFKQNAFTSMMEETLPYEMIQAFAPLTDYQYDHNPLIIIAAQYCDVGTVVSHLNDPDITTATWDRVNAISESQGQGDLFLLTVPKISCAQKINLVMEWASYGGLEMMMKPILGDPCLNGVNFREVLETAIAERMDDYIQLLWDYHRITRDDIENALINADIPETIRELLEGLLE